MTRRAATRSRRSSPSRRRSPPWPSAATGPSSPPRARTTRSGSSTSPTARRSRSSKGPDGTIHALAFSPTDGNLLVSASADKTAKLWKIERGQGRPASSPATPTPCWRSELSRDGKKLVDRLGRQDGQGLDRRRRQERRDARRPRRAGQSVAVSPTHRGSPRARPTTGRGSGSRASGRELQELSAHRSAIVGRGVLARQQVGRLGGGAITRSASGRRPPSASSPGTRGRSSAWPSCRTGRRSSRPRPTRRSRSSRSATGKLVRSLDGHGDAVRAVAVTKDGYKIVSGLGRQDDPHLERGRRQAAADLPRASRPRCSRSPPRRQQDASSSAWPTARARAFDLAQADPAKAERQDFSGHTGAVLAVAVLPDNATLVTASDDRRSGSGRCLRRAPQRPGGPPAQVYSVAWSPDGKQAATGAADKSFRIWDPEKGRASARSRRPTRTWSTPSPTTPRETCWRPPATTSW